MTLLPPRQIHLDFHTSEHIPRVGAEFDAAAFARTVRQAHVASVTVFARCHHGWLYYPSRLFPELVHPQLANKNLLIEQVRALHAEGVAAPVYITVQWDYQSAVSRPEWLIRKQDGAHEGGPFTEPGFYQSLCVNTGYYDFLRRHTEEVCELLGGELDGIFFDIVGIRPCWCASCRAQMKRQGVDASDEAAVRAFAARSLDLFKERMSAAVRGHKPDCSIFYNAGHVGPSTKASAASYTHFELESLPSGSWGYLHFPATARYARKLGLDCMGMTGKFHTSWGDFHSLKNQAALEYECFRMLSYGFACSVGDQLEPGGVLNPATYRLIGSVYGPMEQREPWARPSAPVTEAAVLTSESLLHEHMVPEDVMGAAQMLEELGLQFDIIDEAMDLDAYRLVVLPDGFAAGAGFQRRLDRFAGCGGRVVACARGGLSPEGGYPACFGAEHTGSREAYPDFIVADGALAKGLEQGGEYVIEEQGVTVAAAGASAVLWARAPWFPRKGELFCSHRYTPSAKGEAYPV
ncbi:MAG: beta-galactosidase trimerization domain-containing protein, partial [Clostridiales bacterium]|nr:beta-galactosidase trimerization domain-containing protein [Clostridiales bacterium]